MGLFTCSIVFRIADKIVSKPNKDEVTIRMEQKRTSLKVETKRVMRKRLWGLWGWGIRSGGKVSGADQLPCQRGRKRERSVHSYRFGNSRAVSNWLLLLSTPVHAMFGSDGMSGIRRERKREIYLIQTSPWPGISSASQASTP